MKIVQYQILPMSHNIKLLEGACIISDAHYSKLRPELLSFIKEIESGRVKTRQLILMGDIFDTLFGEVSFTHTINQELIHSLNNISQNIELIYLEGNHDFNLQKIFPKAKVFALKQQPITSDFHNKKIAFAHGDFDLGLRYKLYSFVIRNPLTLILLGFIDRVTKHSILKKLDNYLAKKDDCKTFVGFREYIELRNLEKYKCDYFIEGHYHQNSAFTFGQYKYINLAAFACNQRYFIVKSVKDNEFLEEHSYKER